MTTTTGLNEERQFMGPNDEQEINKLISGAISDSSSGFTMEE